MRLLSLAVGVALCVNVAADGPLTRAHSHNDYLHPRPLFDALDHGFCSVEVDIWLFNGELLVSHDADTLEAKHIDKLNLQRLYLDPLKERVARNGGRVYPDGPEIILLIDIKGPGKPTYLALRDVLKDYADILTTFTRKGIRHGAVRVIISGSRPRSIMESEKKHLAAYDGRLGDLDSDLSEHFMPLISASWTSTFKWRGEGPMPDAERETLRTIVEKAHAKGRILRFWATPHNEDLWQTLFDAGVDLINTDDHPRLRAFLLKQRD